MGATLAVKNTAAPLGCVSALSVKTATCLKAFFDELHAVSTVKWVLNMLHSLAP